MLVGVMKEKIDLFIELSLQQCKKDDYGDSKKVKLHNEATEKLTRLKMQMSDIETKEMLMLLNYNDSRVKINAAQFCFEKQVLIEDAINSLNEVVNTEKDTTLNFSAKILLENGTKS